MTPTYSVVVSTVGRPSLSRALQPLLHGGAAGLAEILVVDDRAAPGADLDVPDGPVPIRVVRSGGNGPAAARNAGWRRAGGEWVAFLDDDVVPERDWCARLYADLLDCAPDVAATQGCVDVPLPDDRRPTDWERNVAGLRDAPWITADMAYRRSVLAEVGGFDERFRRAYREDVDLALRVIGAGHHIVRGERRIAHPVRPASWHVSLRLQRGNADDPLMDALHGPAWRTRCGAPGGRRPRHVVVTGAAAVAGVALAARRPRWAAAAGAVWLAGTAEFAWSRIAPGPRSPREVAAMLATSVLLPPLAVGWWLVGKVRAAASAREPSSFGGSLRRVHPSGSPKGYSVELGPDDTNILRFVREGSANHIRLVGDGEIDAHSATVLRAVAADAIDSGAARIDLDLGRVTFIDSSGLRALAQAHSAAAARGSVLTIVELSPPVRRILEISGMLDELSSPASGPV